MLSLSCQGSLTLTNTTNGFEIEISLTSGPDITVNDTAEQLTCNSGKNSCYIECSYRDFTETFTKKTELGLCVQNQNKTTFEFSIGKQDLFSSIAFNQLCNCIMRNVHWVW